MKLIAGCGDSQREGFIGLDLCPRANIDVQGDIRLLPFADDSFEAIECHHVLEHIPPQDAIRAVAEFYRVLEVGGAITISMPDLETICRIYWLEPERRPIALRGIYGIPHVEGMFHYWGCSGDALKALMERAGFRALDMFTTEEARPTPTLVFVGEKRAH